MCPPVHPYTRDSGAFDLIRTIAFDFGGTLFSTARMGEFNSTMVETFVLAASRELGCSREVALRLFAEFSIAWRARRSRSSDFPEQETSSQDLLRGALSKLGADLTMDQIVAILNAFHGEEAKQFTPFIGVVETLRTLRTEGFTLCIVSNNPWTESIMASLKAHGIQSLFDHVVVSCDVGYRKPHQPIFDQLIANLGHKASQILFVGDSYAHDIVVPKKLGMGTCLVDLEGRNKNNQIENFSEADFFLTQFDHLIPALGSLKIQLLGRLGIWT